MYGYIMILQLCEGDRLYQIRTNSSSAENLKCSLIDFMQ